MDHERRRTGHTEEKQALPQGEHLHHPQSSVSKDHILQLGKEGRKMLGAQPAPVTFYIMHFEYLKSIKKTSKSTRATPCPDLLSSFLLALQVFQEATSMQDARMTAVFWRCPEDSQAWWCTSDPNMRGKCLEDQEFNASPSYIASLMATWATRESVKAVSRNKNMLLCLYDWYTNKGITLHKFSMKFLHIVR